MSVKHAILGFLYQKPRHGYEIKTEFEQMVHKQWPLNTGQIYTTIDRLVRDKFVEPLEGEDQDRKQYMILEEGKKELLDWLLQPVERSLFKDEFYFKLLCAQKINYQDISAMINGQKAKTMQSILQMTRVKTTLNETKEAAMLLLLEGSLLHLEADLRWLELAEAAINSK
ncbi:PadR family transcriptional regulator [Paenibacillus sp. NEAU-GSW1]|uniref:PadR family transcriptional regulator n=1 Tax=Paenibacillus sp. NEAU-GSW1 TaxID=2682486 RepID=UPI0012E1AB20|nr:PadR family transcriptional regulator [Paenibacillus sp. NEAU-GSW1]MUT64876.1 PadR family transcriptional regulator [Paenibacillus sp. NEAU-GSW1]